TNTLALMSAIKRTNLRRGEDHHEWPRTALFDKIGARSVVLETDAFGNFVITGFDYATARDWARLGQFFLQDGHWQGEQLWPEGWSDVIKTPSSANPEYGGQVWVNLHRDWPALPADAYSFSGWLQQHVVIIPSRSLVIVRLGFSEGEGFDPYFNTLLQKILDAVPSN
ncbi:MAG: serine hydrolase, partial [Pseudomonadota bacterium]